MPRPPALHYTANRLTPICQLKSKNMTTIASEVTCKSCRNTGLFKCAYPGLGDADRNPGGRPQGKGIRLPVKLHLAPDLYVWVRGRGKIVDTVIEALELLREQEGE